MAADEERDGQMRRDGGLARAALLLGESDDPAGHGAPPGGVSFALQHNPCKKGPCRGGRLQTNRVDACFLRPAADRCGAARASLASRRAAERGSRRAAGRGQDDARAAGAARRALVRAGASSCWSRAGSPPAPRPSAWRDARRARRRHGGASRAPRIAHLGPDADRGGHRGRLHPDDPRRSRARGRRRSPVRRVPRALPRRRPRPRPGARRAGGLREDLRLLVMSATLDGAARGRACSATRRSWGARAAPFRSRHVIAAATAHGSRTRWPAP